MKVEVSVRLARWLALVAVFGTVRGAVAGPEAPRDHVVVRKGHVLAGRVLGRPERLGDGRRGLRVETDFGQIIVPSDQVLEKRPSKQASNATFDIREIRVVRFSGTVETLIEGAETWQKLSWEDTYGHVPNAPNRMLRPGMTVRTGPDGELDFMPHKDVWIRVVKNSEVFIPSQVPSEKEGSIDLKTGGLLQDVTSRPRGQTFRVRTPLTIVAVPDGATFRLERSGNKERAEVQRGVVVLPAKKLKKGQWAWWTEEESASGKQSREEQQELDYLAERMPRLPVDDMAFVPAGTYPLGGALQGIWQLYAAADPEGMKSKFDNSKHLRMGQVTAERFEHETAAFLIDRRELTRKELLDYRRSLESPVTSTLPEDPVDLRRPAHGIPIEEARKLARWAGKQLMSEVQYEIAARGPQGLPLPWGKSVRKEHRSLAGGTWSLRTGLWVPPSKAASVDAKTADVSPFGVRALVSGVPEWTCNVFGDAPFYERMRAIVRGKERATAVAKELVGKPVTRGCWAELGPRGYILETAGMRGVIELGETRKDR